MGFYEDLKDTAKELANQKQILTSETDLKVLDERMRLFKYVMSVIRDAKFITRSDAREKFQYFINSEFSYQITAEKFNTSVGSVKSSMSQHTKLIINAIGKETLDMIRSGDIEQVKKFLKAKHYAFAFELLYDDSLLSLLKDSLPEPSDIVGFNFSDCDKEIQFLAKYSKPNIQSELLDLDFVKLATLIQALKADSHLLNNKREAIVAYLEDKISEFDFLIKMSEAGEEDVYF